MFTDEFARVWIVGPCGRPSVGAVDVGVIVVGTSDKQNDIYICNDPFVFLLCFLDCDN